MATAQHPTASKALRLALAAIIVLNCASIRAELPSENHPSENHPSEYRGASEPSTPAEIYGQGVRETDWKSPVEEQAGFHLSPGFKVELFAAEPEITKPLNMAWDTRGRLWVTCTVEYPYPVTDGKPRDTIRILEDTDRDGRADKFTTFAEGLNIPMGILPVADGVICFNIPNIVHLKDTDGDDRADETIELLGPFDTTRDTHGMVNSLSSAADGWIYACHGFNNQSEVTARDGSTVTLHSGNTFRFKPDGSRIEHYTRGQVNPFGMTRDEWGNWYSADCHSKPLTALLPGACYPSFGRPHDGLGFAPDMMEHLHGSTAICGLVYYQADHFPPNYRNLFYSGNVMTSRINCNAIRWNGATPTAKEQADFMTSEDPWFRPVDIQLGMDGGLYVADFYNKIIGHYEVPLEHPGRDRNSGRIWRISYAGEDSQQGDGDNRSILDVNPLADPNLTSRRAAIERLVERKDLESQENFAKLQSTATDGEQSALLRQSALEVLFRCGQLNPSTLEQLLRDDESHLRVLALSLAAESSPMVRKQLLPTARKSLDAGHHAQVRKAAVRLIGQSGETRDILPLLEIAALEGDPMLSQAAKIAARNLLRAPSHLQSSVATWLGLPSSEFSIALDSDVAPVLATVLPGLEGTIPARSLLAYCTRNPSASASDIEQAIEFASRFMDDETAPHVLEAIDRFSEAASVSENGAVDNALGTSDNVTVARASMIQRLLDALRGRGIELPSQIRAEAQRTATSLLHDLGQRIAIDGRSSEWIDRQGESWAPEHRNAEDGTTAAMTSSLSRSEQYMGVLRSEAFACPEQLAFWLCGHNGLPSADDHRKNFVRLIRDATGEVLATAYPPRSDKAQNVEWELSSYAGQRVRIECVDGDAGNAYAWLAVGRFSLPQLENSSVRNLMDAIDGLLKSGMETEETVTQLDALDLSDRQRGRLIASLLAGRSTQPLATLAQAAIAIDRCELLSSDLLDRVPVVVAVERNLTIAKELAASAAAGDQANLVKQLLGTRGGCELTLQLLQNGGLGLRALKGVEAVFPNGLDAALRKALDEQFAAAAGLPLQTVDVNARVASLDWSAASLDSGQQIFKQHCAACHQFAKEGQLVGPQLDGVKLRGPARLSEDILDPNRNVDKAFRMTSLLLDDERVLSGLVREDSDGSLTITGQDGKPISVPANSVSGRRESEQSLMPSNFGEVLGNQQLVSLLKYLAEGP